MQAKASAAKLHVLALAPLKEQLGSKWPRLSELVHKLFETAIARAQGPGDYFAQLDELSYIAIFRSLTMADATRVCGLIAREVCQALFGDQVEEVSVRKVVSFITVPAGADLPHVARVIEAMLERDGTETVFTQSAQCTPPVPVAAVPATALKPQLPEMERIADIRSTLSEFGLKAMFLPVWDLQRRQANSLLLTRLADGSDRLAAVGGGLFDPGDPKQVADVEIMLLEAVRAYAGRVSAARKVCAVCVGVSYETLSVFQSRIRYITALQKLRLLRSTPLMLKIEQIPEGTPAARIGELAAILKLPNIRLILEFQSLRAIPKFEFRINAVGLGGALPRTTDHDLMLRTAKGYVENAAAQKLFAFVNHLDNEDAIRIAAECNVHFGTGLGFNAPIFTGLEAVPDFPLTLPG
ncbi:MAG: hypothetical protein KGL26_03290 [Pseudomonadota bacterium]|nr:hypothetical protein [Pseudomonadota bacterium]